VVDATNWCSDIPTSLEHARSYFSPLDPGAFFKPFAPANQALLVLVLVLLWKSGNKVRLFLIGAVVCSVINAVFTMTYFYPRNELLFVADLPSDLRTIRDACGQWQQMNWVRSLVVLTGLVLQFLALDSLTTGSANAARASETSAS
jgi:uncharacterized membrane protein